MCFGIFLAAFSKYLNKKIISTFNHTSEISWLLAAEFQFVRHSDLREVFFINDLDRFLVLHFKPKYDYLV